MECNSPTKIPMVEILLSTYNGEKFLAPLLDSILTQDYPCWRLLVRDDGSSDATQKIINRYARSNPSRFRLLEKDENIGFTESFSTLIGACKADYIALCDQDDIWLPGKLTRQMDQLRSMEGRIGRAVPILTHSDLEIMNNNLGCVSRSMWKYQGIVPEKMKKMRTLLIQNFVTGCTVLMNRALAEKSMPIPRSAISHDWWIALVAMAQGYIITDPKALVMYRQHDSNTIGARRWGFSYILETALKNRKKWIFDLKRTISQAASLGRYENNRDGGVIQSYSTLDQNHWVARKIAFYRLGIKKYGTLRHLSAWFYL